MKVLNLDALAVVHKTVTVNGVEHAVKDMSVADFVAANAQAKKLKNEDDVALNMEANVDYVARVLPTMTREEVAALNFHQLFSLISFINSAVEDAGAPGEAIANKDEAGK